MTSHPDLLELAKNGNCRAIAKLMNRALQAKGINAKITKITLKYRCLQIMLEAPQIPDQQSLVSSIYKGLIKLGSEHIEEAEIYGKKTGEEIPAWHEKFDLLAKSPTSLKVLSASSSNTTPNDLIKNLQADNYRVIGEKEILYASLGVLAVFLFILLGISFGFAVFMLVVAVIAVKVQQLQCFGVGIKVSEKQLPEIHEIAQLSAQRLCMRTPNVFVKESPTLNAFAIGFLDEKKTVVIHSALVEAMNKDELAFILGHEFSHIKCDHTNYIVLTNTAENIAKIPILSDVLGFIFLLWSRKCEYTCDRGGLIANHNLKAAISALTKLAVGKELFEKIDIETFLSQKREIDANDISKLTEIFETHPYIVNRIHEITNFYESESYKQIVSD